MFPPVLRLGPLQVAWSSISLVVGLMAGVAWLCWRVKTPDQRWRDVLRLVIDTYGPLGLVAVVVGRLVYVLAQGSYFVEHPGEALVVWQGGISAQGAVVGLLLGLTWRFRTWPAWLRAADALTVPVVLLVLAGWVSCGLAGCAYGPLVDVGRQPGLAAFDWPDLYGVVAPRVPVQLVGITVALLCLLWCLWLARRYTTPGILFSSALPTWVCRPCGPTRCCAWRGCGWARGGMWCWWGWRWCWVSSRGAGVRDYSRQRMGETNKRTGVRGYCANGRPRISHEWPSTNRGNE